MDGSTIGLFEDDDGSDFATEIFRSREIDVILNALRAVPTEERESVEPGVSARALLAAEMIADQMGHEGGGLPDELHSWIHEFGDADNELIRLARKAVNRILRSSAANAFAMDSSSFSTWESETRDLAERLKW